MNAVSAAARHAQNAGAERSHLRLVLKPGGDGGLLSGMLAAYAEQPDARHVEILFSGPIDRADHLLDGRADVGLLYAPFDPLDGLAYEALYTEERVAVLPVGHRLAGRGSVRLADLEDEKRPVWKGIAKAGDSGDGSFGGSAVADVVQMLHMVALSQVIEVLPRSLIPPLPPGIVLVPVADAPPSRLVLAWNEYDRRPLVASFVAAALTMARE